MKYNLVPELARTCIMTNTHFDIDRRCGLAERDERALCIESEQQSQVNLQEQQSTKVRHEGPRPGIRPYLFYLGAAVAGLGAARALGACVQCALT